MHSLKSIRGLETLKFSLILQARSSKHQIILALSFKMQIIYLSENTNVSTLPLALYDTKGHNKYGTMYMLQDKIELVTREPITEYRIFRAETGKQFLCIKNANLSAAIKGLTDKITQDHGHVFRPEKEMLYLRITPDQALAIPKNQKLNVSVHVYGVFYQTSTKLSFLQMEISGFKAYPLIDFDAIPQ
jgi:hypothetical protein